MPELVVNGPIIPVGLMNELDDGKVVFFCGAGVSAGPGSDLPRFAELVDHVYTTHHIEPDDVEREALDHDRKNSVEHRPNFDRVLGLLERPCRLGAPALRKTVIKRLLKRRTGDLPVHKALIALSKIGGHVRLVTTNFDNRFVQAGLSKWQVDAAPKLPVPKPHSWSSLVHLHGRALRNDDGSNLVLTAADFGRAYLTERWAARFITELFREFTVVFVGYSLGDPVMSYMVDALAAERAKGARFAKAYAFADHDGTDDGIKKAQDGWCAKNVEPIPYDKKNDHHFLAETLVRWAQIRSDPYQARSQIAINEISKPDGPNDSAAERVVWALQDPVAAEALANAPPATNKEDFEKIGKWLDTFAEKGLLCCNFSDASVGAEGENPAFARLVYAGQSLKDPGTLDTTRQHLARWIARHLHVPQVLTSVRRNGDQLHPGLGQQIRICLDDPNIPPSLRLLWTVFLDHEPSDPWRFLWIVHHYKAAASPSERRHIEDEAVKSIAPRLVLHPGIDACVHLKLTVGDDETWEEVRDILQNSSVLSRHAATLTGHLERALALGADSGAPYSNSFSYRPSIKQHDQNRNRDHDGWTRLIDLVRDSYFALAAADRYRGDNLLRRWAISDQPLFNRLALHALAENPKSDCQLARKLLISGRKPGLWELELRRETLRLFRRAGKRLPRSLRAEIVRAIHAGPKLGRKQRGTPELVRRQKALRLYKLQVSGAKLDKESASLAAEAAPPVGSPPGNRDEFVTWQGEARSVGIQEFAPEDLLNGSLADVVTAIEQERIDDDSFRGLVHMRPSRIATALRRLGIRKIWPGSNWRDLLWSIAFPHERPVRNRRLENFVAQVLRGAPDELFADVDSAAADFVGRLAEDHPIDQESELMALWERAWTGKGQMTTRDLEDPQDALNHAAGKLADAALVRLRKHEPEAGEGLPQQVRSYFEKVADDRDGQLGRVMLAASLHYLHVIDRNWVEASLLPLLNPERSEEAAALWSAYLWTPAWEPDLLQAFKESFLQIFSDDALHGRTQELTRLFVSICLDGPNQLTTQEKQRAVGSMSQDALRNILLCLAQRLKGEAQEQAQVWRDMLYPWLRDYWPQADGRNTSKTSAMMCYMLAQCGDAFREAARWSLPYLRPVRVQRIGGRDSHFSRGLRRLHENGHADSDPELVIQVLDNLVVADGFPVRVKGILRELLDAVKDAAPNSAADNRFQRLYNIAHH